MLALTERRIESRQWLTDLCWKEDGNEGIAVAIRRSGSTRAEAGDGHDRDRPCLAGISDFLAPRPFGIVGHFPDNGGWRLRLRSRSFWLRKIDAALYRRRLRPADPWHSEGEGQGDHRARSRSRAGVSGVRAVSLEECARQRNVWSAPAGREAGGGRGAEPRADRDGRAQGLRGLLSQGIVRGDEAVRRVGGAPCLSSRGPLEGGAVRRVACPNPNPPAE